MLLTLISPHYRLDTTKAHLVAGSLPLLLLGSRLLSTVFGCHEYLPFEQAATGSEFATLYVNASFRLGRGRSRFQATIAMCGLCSRSPFSRMVCVANAAGCCTARSLSTDVNAFKSEYAVL